MTKASATAQKYIDNIVKAEVPTEQVTPNFYSALRNFHSKGAIPDGYAGNAYSNRDLVETDLKKGKKLKREHLGKTVEVLEALVKEGANFGNLETDDSYLEKINKESRYIFMPQKNYKSMIIGFLAGAVIGAAGSLGIEDMINHYKHAPVVVQPVVEPTAIPTAVPTQVPVKSTYVKPTKVPTKHIEHTVVKPTPVVEQPKPTPKPQPTATPIPAAPAGGKKKLGGSAQEAPDL